MIFSSARLRELCPQPDGPVLPRIAIALETWASDYGVNTLQRRAHFLGQVAHESGGFRRLTENLNYSAERIAQVWPRLASRADELAHQPEQLANAAYGGRKDLGNGDGPSGDGWRYRGRGLIQLTGRDNYRWMGVALALEFIGNPDQVAVPEIAARTALAFWQMRGCNDVADGDDFEKLTRIINGGAHGLAERIMLTEKAKRIFVTLPAEGLIA